MDRNEYLLTPAYLQHHGILGQRWGVRRFQNPDGTLTNAGKKRKAEGNSANEKSEETKDKKLKLTDSQKRAIAIGAAVAATALATYGAYKLGVFDNLTGGGIDYDVIKKYAPQEYGFDPIVKPHTALEDIAEVNKDGSTKNNCLNASIAYLMRRYHELDVRANSENPDYDEASGMYTGGLRDLRMVNTIFKGATLKTLTGCSSMKDVDSFLLAKGEGGHGIIRVAGDNFTKGHFIVWENVNGKVRYSDPQSFGAKSTPKLMRKLFFDIDMNGFYTQGLDFSSFAIADLTHAVPNDDPTVARYLIHYMNTVSIIM